MPKDIQIGIIIGLILGALSTVYMFNNVQWYHDLLVWSWTNPWIVIPCLLTGIGLAMLDELD